MKTVLYQSVAICVNHMKSLVTLVPLTHQESNTSNFSRIQHMLIYFSTVMLTLRLLQGLKFLVGDHFMEPDILAIIHFMVWFLCQVI